MRQEQENGCKQEFDTPNGLVQLNNHNGLQTGPGLPATMMDTRPFSRCSCGCLALTTTKFELLWLSCGMPAWQSHTIESNERIPTI